MRPPFSHPLNYNGTMSRLLPLLYLIFLLSSACNSSTPRPITFMVFGDLAELSAYQDLVAAFERQHAEIQVELIHIPSQTDYRARLAADFAAGTPADVILLNYRRFAQFAAKGALEPLGDFLERSQLLSLTDFYPQALEAFQWQGKLICIPQNLSSLVVYYNKKLFDMASLLYPQDGWTWSDLLTTAQILTRDTDDDTRIDQYGLGTEVSLARFAPFIWQHGGEVVDNTLTPSRLTLDWPLSLEAIQWLVDLQMRYHVIPNAEAEAAENSESRFLNGRLGMFLNSRRGVPTYRQITAFDWDVAPLPRDAHIATMLHSDAYCMPSSVKDKNRVWTFIEFANSPTGQAIIAASGRTVPSIKSVAESFSFLDPTQKPLNARAFLDPMPYIRNFPVTSTWIDIEEIADEELRRAFYGQASIKEAVTAAIQRAARFFDPDADTP